jgi:hypothetical protein
MTTTGEAVAAPASQAVVQSVAFRCKPLQLVAGAGLWCCLLRIPR